MLSLEENTLFTSVSRGTRMGDMLRRYWHPVGCSQSRTAKPQRIKVMGEELVLYRGVSGEPHLMQLRCAHRSLALDYGRVEGDCIRCPYHGWLYDADGSCLDQPAEPEGSSFKEKIKVRAYKAQEVSGLIFGYLGPDPAPVLPLFDCLRASEGTKYLQVQQTHCNWFNHIENVVDVSHLAWLHGYTFRSLLAHARRSTSTGIARRSAPTTSCKWKASKRRTSRATAFRTSIVSPRRRSKRAES